MNKIELQNVAREYLADRLDVPGSILYSSHETLKRGDIYLLGFNPGGSGGEPVRKSIDSILNKITNSYLDESWSNKKTVWAKGEAPLQKRICWLLEKLGVDPRNVCASNLIFFQSSGYKEVEYSLADICWPIHEIILSIVKPRLIIVFGNSSCSPYHFLHEKFGGEEESFLAGHGKWSVKGFRCLINGENVYVAGFPHLSRYCPVGKNGIDKWLLKNFEI